MTNTMREPLEESKAITIESMIETIEQLKKEFPDIGECPHHELITSKYLPPSEHGTWHVCTKCWRPLLIPAHLFVETREG